MAAPIHNTSPKERVKLLFCIVRKATPKSVIEVLTIIDNFDNFLIKIDSKIGTKKIAIFYKKDAMEELIVLSPCNSKLNIKYNVTPKIVPYNNSLRFIFLSFL